MDYKAILGAIIYFGLPILVLLVALLVVGLTIRHRGDIKKFLRIGKTVQTGLEVADIFLPDSEGFTTVKNLINDIVYSVEEISKNENLSSEEKHNLAKNLYKEALEEFNLKDSYTISDNLLNALIKGSVFIMNKTLLKKDKNEDINKDTTEEITKILNEFVDEEKKDPNIQEKVRDILLSDVNKIE